MKVAQLCLTLCKPMDSAVHGILQAGIMERVSFPSPGDLPSPGIEPMSPTLQADSLPAEPQEKPKYTVVGSPSLLQSIFLTQESNQGLLHCRQILYQLSYEGSQESLPAQNKSTSTWENMNLKCIGRDILSHARLFETPWTAAHQAPLSMGFSRQEYWSG